MDQAPSTHPALSLLENLPPRSAKPRAAGLTMVMDKGLSLMEAEAFLENAAP
ncbi:MAG: phosphosulfolactate synthase, partial [Bacteroidota bacterium]